MIIAKLENNFYKLELTFLFLIGNVVIFLKMLINFID